MGSQVPRGMADEEEKEEDDEGGAPGVSELQKTRYSYTRNQIHTRTLARLEVVPLS